MAVNGHARRLDVVARKLTPDPEKEITLEHVSAAIAQLEANPETTTLLGMPRERLGALVEAEIARLAAELGKR